MNGSNRKNGMLEAVIMDKRRVKHAMAAISLSVLLSPFLSLWPKKECGGKSE